MSDVVREFHGVVLSIKDAGTFKNEEGKEVQFEDSIKIKVGQNFVKVSAIQLAGLKAALLDPEVREELQTRFVKERENLENLGGF